MPELCIMLEHFGECKNDNFNTQVGYKLTGYYTRLAGQSTCPDSSG